MQRESPKRCEYYGLTLWYHGIYRAGMLYRIRISLRKEHANPDMPGKIILERDYTVDKDTTLTKSTAIPADLLHGMISNALFRRSFFRAICDACPEMYSPDLAWGIAGPYALDAWLRLQSVGRDRQIKFARAMEQMVTLWGEKSVAEITPVNCAKDLMDMAPSRADICLTVLRHLFRSTLAPIVPDPDMWVRYHFSGRKGQYAENHRDREIRDLPILSDKQCADIISTCLIHAKDDHRYLAVLLCLLTPLEPEEIGALKWGDISPLDDYPDVWTIRVRHILIPAEDSRRGAKRQRKVRNVICDISDPHELRTIPADCSPRCCRPSKSIRPVLITCYRIPETRNGICPPNRWSYGSIKSSQQSHAEGTPIARLQTASAAQCNITCPIRAARRRTALPVWQSTTAHGCSLLCGVQRSGRTGWNGYCTRRVAEQHRTPYARAGIIDGRNARCRLWQTHKSGSDHKYPG